MLFPYNELNDSIHHAIQCSSRASGGAGIVFTAVSATAKRFATLKFCQGVGLLRTLFFQLLIFDELNVAARPELGCLRIILHICLRPLPTPRLVPRILQ